jgi:uncharacterized protein (TIGR00730 family)
MGSMQKTANLRNICVYCGSGPGHDPAFAQTARDLGRILAAENIGLVYGGGSLGLMGETARSVIRHGGRVTGIIPAFLSEREHMLLEAQELVVVENMHQRKHLMFLKSDAFVALPGGLGTLEEFVEQLTWSQLERHQKPIVLANIGGFWNPLLKLFSDMRQEGFIRHGLELHLEVVHRVDAIIPAIARGLVPRDKEAEAGIEAKVSAKF